MSITGPATPNKIKAIPPDGGGGTLGGRSNPVNLDIRHFGDNINTVAPAAIGIYDNTIPSATVVLGGDSAPTKTDAAAYPIGDSEGAVPATAHPGRVN